MNIQAKEVVKKIAPSWLVGRTRLTVARYRYWNSKRYVGRLLGAEKIFIWRLDLRKKEAAGIQKKTRIDQRYRRKIKFLHFNEFIE